MLGWLKTQFNQLPDLFIVIRDSLGVWPSRVGRTCHCCCARDKSEHMQALVKEIFIKVIAFELGGSNPKDSSLHSIVSWPSTAWLRIHRKNTTDELQCSRFRKFRNLPYLYGMSTVLECCQGILLRLNATLESQERA